MDIKALLEPIERAATASGRFKNPLIRCALSRARGLVSETGSAIDLQESLSIAIDGYLKKVPPSTVEYVDCCLLLAVLWTATAAMPTTESVDFYMERISTLCEEALARLKSAKKQAA